MIESVSVDKVRLFESKIRYTPEIKNSAVNPWRRLFRYKETQASLGSKANVVTINYV